MSDLLPPDETDYDKLLNMSLMINDKLRIRHDHVEADLSMNEVEDFHQLVNHLWHKRNGWIKSNV